MNKRRIRIEVFVPLGSCSCHFAPLLEKVGSATSKFSEFVEVQVKGTTSKEAKAYAVNGSCVIVDGSVKFSVDFDEKHLEEAISLRLSAAH